MNGPTPSHHEGDFPSQSTQEDLQADSSPAVSDEQLDALLTQHVLQPPDDFISSVMAAIETEEVRTSSAIEGNNEQALATLTWWQWLALLCAGTPSVAQVFTLIFSVWHVTSAG